MTDLLTLLLAVASDYGWLRTLAIIITGLGVAGGIVVRAIVVEARRGFR